MSGREWPTEAYYSGPNWLASNRRIVAYPQAALLIVAKFPQNQWRFARRTAVCAAGTNTPEWQRAVAQAYPHHIQGSLFGAAA